MSVPYTGQRYRRARKRWAEQHACDGRWDKYLRVKREGRAYDASEYGFDYGCCFELELNAECEVTP